MVTGNDVMYDTILGELREADLSGGTGGGGGGGYADSAGFAFTAGELQSGATVNGATVTFSNIPQSAVADLETALSGKSDIIFGGYRIGVTSSGGSATIDQDKWFPITNVTGASVTMYPGEAYKIQATTAAVTINTTTVPANQYGLESHLEIFVANTGYIVTGTNVVLANALELDAVNNCTVRFHDGFAIISVEDHIAGYVVTVNAASGAGTLNYALSAASNEYVSFNDTLAGQVLDLGGVVTSAGEKHVVGNGYTDTILSGGITCTSKTTFSYLGMNGVVVSSGTLTLGDVYIPNGATVSLGGGSLAVEKVTGDGTINLGWSNVFVSSGATAYANGCHVVSGASAFRTSRGTIKLENCVFSGNATALNQTLGTISATACVFAGNSSTQGGAVYTYYGAGTYSACVFSSNSASALGGALQLSDNTATLVSCSFDGNVSPNFADALGIVGAGKAIVSGCSFGTAQNIQLRENGNVTLIGSNALGGIITTRGGTSDSDTVTISSGAILDFSGNTSSPVIQPRGGITFAPGGATVLYDHDSNGSALGSSASFMIAGAKVEAIQNGGVVTMLTGSVFLGNPWVFRDVNVKNSSFLFIFDGGVITLDNSKINYPVFGSGPSGNRGSCVIKGSTTIGNRVQTDTVLIESGARVTLVSDITGNIVNVEADVQVNGNPISSGVYTKVNSNGTTEPPQA